MKRYGVVLIAVLVIGFAAAWASSDNSQQSRACLTLACKEQKLRNDIRSLSYSEPTFRIQNLVNNILYKVEVEQL